ncbi:MAG: S8 family serine peptidase [Parvularculaceae bacterium]
MSKALVVRASDARQASGVDLRQIRRSSLFGSVAPLAIAGLAFVAFSSSALAQPNERKEPAPVTNEASGAAISGQYIVVFKRGAPAASVAAAAERIKAMGGEIIHLYTRALVGFSVRLPREPDRAKVALETLRTIPDIDYIAADQRISINAITNQPINAATDNVGLDRITERLPPMDGFYDYDGAGAGVHAFVIDTGINVTHVDFGGRASWFYDSIGGNVDCHGHGTNVAGILGAATYGVAKSVTLHAARVLDCAGSGDANDAIDALDEIIVWKTANPTLPAVANLSLGSGVFAPFDTAIANTVAAQVTVVVAAGNDSTATTTFDACNRSPAREPTAITVGNVNPANDTRRFTSNVGTCLDLFAPGVGIRATGIANNTATLVFNGTSQAAPHVAGVAARYLASYPSSTPAQVWARIDLMANVFPGTAGWAGVVDPGTGSPNKLLYWGAVDDTFDDGDPHIRTVDGVHYDFQSAGEFIALRDRNGLEIQTRQSPVSTQPPIANAHTALAMCVSLNTALAARVGSRRVTYQPGPEGMIARIDGVATALTAAGTSIGPGARVSAAPAGQGIDIDFPDGTSLTATSNFWGAPHNRWYLNLSVFRTPASEGLMGDIAPGSWLPLLSNNTSLGAKPASAAQRYIDLYQTFADAWRVSGSTSLFDYAPGESPATFENKKWPPENPPCVIPQTPVAQPMDRGVAAQLCRAVREENRRANCAFDVAITGDPGFAKAYLVSERIEAGATKVTLGGPERATNGKPTVLTAAVARRSSSGKGAPNGTVQFMIDGAKAGAPVKLDKQGVARLTIDRLKPGKHSVSARYSPPRASPLLVSYSDEAYVVSGERSEAN